MANKIQIRRDTTANWTASDPILSQGELGLDTTLNKVKIGNGTSHWSALSFYTGNPSSLINGLHTVSLDDNGLVIFPSGESGQVSIQGGELSGHNGSPLGLSSNTSVVISTWNPALHSWEFTNTGGINFPTLSVDIHNGGVQSAQVLKFDDTTQQVIITGPTPAAGSDAQRIIIQGQRATGNGEGGDVYLWGGDSAVNGGDIKIYAGDGEASPSNGGYVNIAGGNGYAYGGDVTLTAGYASQFGGNVVLSAGNAGGQDGVAGQVTINASNHSWTFTNDGKLQLPAGGDIVNNAGNSITDIYKFAGGTIGTKNSEPTSNGWGGHNMYLDPGGESWASIFIPSVTNQDGGASLQIINKGAASSTVQVVGWGGVQLVTNTGGSEKLFEFGDDGKLTLPAASLIVSETSSTVSVGAGLAELETTYTDLMLMLNDVFTAISSEPGYPWGVTLPVSVPLTYNQLIQLLPDTFTGQDNATVVAHNATTAYNVWQDAADVTNIQVNVSDKSWVFGPDGKLTLPLAGIVKAGADTAQVGSTTTIAFSDGGPGNLFAYGPEVLAVDYNDNVAILTTYTAGSTITFANGDVRTITAITGAPGEGIIDIAWTGAIADYLTTNQPAFPITLKTANYAAATTSPQWTFGEDGKLLLPGGNAQIVAESTGGVRIGTADTNAAPNAQIRIGGVDHVFEIFGGSPAYSWKFDINGKLTLPGTTYASTSPNYIHAEYGIGLHPTHNTGGTGPELYVSYNDGILVQPVTNDYLQGGIAAAPLFINGADLPNNSDSIGKLPGNVFIESGTNYQDSTHGKVVIKTGTNQWSFGTNGKLTLPTNGTVSYVPTTTSDWAGTPPSTLQEAIDRLAAAIKALNTTGA